VTGSPAPANPYATDPFAAPPSPAAGAVPGPNGFPVPPGARRHPGRPRKGRAAVAWILGLGIPLGLALTMTALLTVPTDDTWLSVGNPAPDGARAVAQVLGRNGVTVIAAPSTAEAVAQSFGDTTLAIAGSAEVSDTQQELYATAECDVVLIEPDPYLREYLESSIPEERLRVYEDAEVFTNGGITDGDRAATALRALGGHRRLVWNVAGWEDDSGTPTGMWGLLPPWAELATLQLVIAAAGAALWRGRRMGRIVPDELPVTVPASEVTVGLGRLYRRSQAVGHAAAALRAGAATRAGAALGLGWSSEPATLVAGIAQATSRPEANVRELLYGPAPVSAGQLAALARDLDQLEKEVLSP
jgi:hypothetical protein